MKINLKTTYYKDKIINKPCSCLNVVNLLYVNNQKCLILILIYVVFLLIVINMIIMKTNNLVFMIHNKLFKMVIICL